MKLLNIIWFNTEFVKTTYQNMLKRLHQRWQEWSYHKIYIQSGIGLELLYGICKVCNLRCKDDTQETQQLVAYI